MSERDLTAVRAELDAIDEELVGVLCQRAQRINDVIAYKRARGIGVVDRRREDSMLQRIAQVAEARGLDPRIAQQVLRAVIDAFTLLEVEQLSGETE